jgi:hypothetical protein
MLLFMIACAAVKGKVFLFRMKKGRHVESANGFRQGVGCRSVGKNKTSSDVTKFQLLSTAHI